MTGFNHGVTGAVIALVVKEPLAAIPLSFASHFVIDAIPHFGVREDQVFKTWFNVTLLGDFLFAVSTMLVLGAWFPEHRLLIWACMIAAASPDLMWAYYWLYIKRIKHRTVHFGPLAKLHAVVQWSQTTPGVVIEAAWFVTMGTVLVSMR